MSEGRVIAIKNSEGKKLWKEWMGERELSADEELARLRELKREKKLDWRKIYKLYLHSKTWRTFRVKVIERDKACVSCGSTKLLHVDHLRYTDFGKEILQDCVTLCGVCHRNKTKSFSLFVPRVKVRVQEDQPLYSLLRS